MKYENSSSAETLEVGWKGRHIIDPKEHLRLNLFPPISPLCHSIMARYIFWSPCSIKEKNALNNFHHNCPKIKMAKTPLQLSHAPSHPWSHIVYDTLCMCSLTAVYINIFTKRQLHIVYVNLTELRIQRESMLWRKGPSWSLPLSVCPRALHLVPLPSFFLFAFIIFAKTFTWTSVAHTRT